MPARLLVVVLLLLASSLRAAEPFELAGGDRVLLVGGTFVEREQVHSYLDTAIAARLPQQKVVVRNLGWSGDTVWGHARASFGSPQDGFNNLLKLVREEKPTVIVVAYGMNASFKGPEHLPKFVEGLTRLVGELKQTQARLVFVGPLRHENLGPPLPEPATHNENLKRYVSAIKKLAEAEQAPFVDLFAALGDGTQHQPPHPLTDNGIHPTAYGYWRAAAAIETGLGLDAPVWHVSLDAGKQQPQATGTRVSNVQASASGVRFTAHDLRLPAPAAPEGSPKSARWQDAVRTLKVTGLAAGNYALSIDGQPVAEAKADGWAAGVALSSGPEFTQAEQLRQKCVDKNQLYFHQWRPQNWTYLFGFRKHEQGQNAVEIPQFAPLVAAAEEEIVKAATPRPHQYELKKK